MCLKRFKYTCFNMTAGKSESKMLKDISCECKYKFDGRKCN